MGSSRKKISKDGSWSNLVELSPTSWSNLHWLPVPHRSVFKTATLVYKFLHTGFPKYFTPYSSSYNTRRSQSGGNFLVIPKFQPSVHKSVKQFGHSFAFDAPTVWNALPDSCVPLSCLLQKTAQNLPLHQGIPSLVLLTLVFSVMLNFFLSMDIEIGCLFLFCCTLESPSYWGD